jgi:L-fuconolactonase
MRIIDAHQHFWKYHPQNHAWINDDMKIIQKDFLPADLSKILTDQKVEGSISVQVDQTNEETAFQIECAHHNPFIKGVVGWIDLLNPLIEKDIEAYKEKNIVKGFRHILQGTEKGFMLQPNFINGLKQLSKHHYTYDLLIYANQIQEAIELIKVVEDLPIVLDHIAKPSIKTKSIEDWKKDIKSLAKYPNLYCKISGMVTEADWTTWKSEDLKPYLDIVVEAFGVDRLLFGSDWPVCLVASRYERWLNTIKDYFKEFSISEQEKIFALNCESFYTLEKA